MLWAAAIRMAGVHAVMGGREVAGPLGRSAMLDPVVRAVALMCWHFTTVAILAMALCYAAGAIGWGAAPVWLAVAMSVAFAVIGVAMAVRDEVSLAKAPQGPLFLPPALLGIWSLLA